MRTDPSTTRRHFLRGAGALAVTAWSWPRLLARQEGEEVLLGTGRHTYRWVHEWAHLPEGMTWGSVHGCIVVDSKDRVYVNTNTDHAVVMVDADGTYRGSWGEEWKDGLHGMCVRQEEGGEFLYMTHLGRHVAVKCTLAGEVLCSFGVPEKAGIYQDPGQYKPTCVAVAPDGDLYVADGYGLSWVHQFHPDGEYVRSFGGPGEEPGKMRTPHGITLDQRGPEPLLIVADRENHRLQFFDLEGRLQHIVTGMLRRPCHVHHSGDDLVVADLAGRVTILDGKNELVTHLGDNPDPALRAQNGVPREKWKDGEFISPHCACFDSKGDLYVQDWLALGRVTKLERV